MEALNPWAAKKAAWMLVVLFVLTRNMDTNTSDGNWKNLILNS